LLSQAPPRRLAEFARALLRHEAEKAGTGNAPATGFQPVCRILYQRLAPLISSAGFEALFARAIKLAYRDHPVLDTVGVAVNGDCALTGLRAVIDGHEPQEAFDALAAVVANFIWLLVIFLGENLGLRKVREGWPQVPFDRTDSSGAEE
jgi:hypothetical protein